MSERTRAEHIQWCKQRAMEYVEHGDLPNAVASMASDLTKHPETKAVASFSVIGILAAAQGDVAGVKQWIKGFSE